MSRSRCPLFVELCAGTAAVSLSLHGGRKARPPVSRMGSKRGYASAILGACGLYPGERAERYLWCEPDPGVRLLLEAYRDPELAREAAAIIRGWAGEEPRALWERLRAEGPPRGPEPREVARWSTLQRWGYGNAPIAHNGKRWTIPHNGPDSPSTFGANNFGTTATTANGLERNDCTGLPATIHDDARTIDPPQLPPGSVVYIDPPYAPLSAVVAPMLAAERLTPGPCDRSEADAALLASGLDGAGEAVGHLRVSVLEVLRSAGVQAQVLQPVVERIVVDVVDDLIWGQWASKVAFHDKSVFGDCAPLVTDEPVAVARPPSPLAGAPLGGLLLPFRGHLRRTLAEFYVATGNPSPMLPQALAWADRILSMGARPVSADKVSPADIALNVERHCRLRFDVRQGISTSLARPPGKAVTGYGHDLPRSEVVALARRWADAGALVVISEQEPLPALMADGWHSMRLTSTRRGQKRTFSRQQEEWLTMSAPPVVRPLVQQGLFA